MGVFNFDTFESLNMEHVMLTVLTLWNTSVNVEEKQTFCETLKFTSKNSEVFRYMIYFASFIQALV